jgi:GR25 family glycosyltransferase involved in LPS biosynthesis
MAATTDIDWVVISLKRTPERMELFELINAHVGLPYEVMEAIDGQLLDREELARTGITVEGLEWTPGAIGAALSHRLCWERAIETGLPVGILEDDVVLRHDFIERRNDVFSLLPDDWEIVHLGFNTDGFFNLSVYPNTILAGGFSSYYPTWEDCQRFAASSGQVIPVRANNTFGNCCYAVSPKGAKRLIDGCFPLSRKNAPMSAMRAVILAKNKDTLMNEFYSSMGAYVCLPPIALPINDKQISTIE